MERTDVTELRQGEVLARIDNKTGALLAVERKGKNLR